jgi:uncharacterized protein (DUF488 family)
MNPPPDIPHLLTIGYEGMNIEMFIDRLKEYGVVQLIDVRNSPWSRKADFSKNRLGEHLEGARIGYLHMPELGISRERRQAVRGKDGEEALLREYDRSLDEEILKRLVDISSTARAALMCLEKDVGHCHRGIIAERLRKMGVPVLDI